MTKTATTQHVDHEGYITLVYHATPVVRYNPARGHVVLNNGGYRTATTKSRINDFASEQALGFSVRQKDGQWLVDLRSGDTLQWPSEIVDFRVRGRA